MVGADELGGEAAACGAVDGVAEDLSVAVDNTILAGEEFVLGMDVEGVGQLLGGSQLTTQVFAVDPEAQLVGQGGLVLDAIVDVVVGYAGSGAEGYLASEVGKEIESVVMVVFDAIKARVISAYLPRTAASSTLPAGPCTSMVSTPSPFHASILLKSDEG